MRHITISARSNLWVQQWMRWQSKPRERKAAGLVWLEGEHLVKEALTRSFGAGTNESSNPNAAARQFTVQEIVLPDTPQAKTDLQSLCENNQVFLRLPALRVVYLNPSVYSQLCHLDSTPSVCCVVQLRAEAPVNYAQSSVVLDGVQDPGNVGTVLRLCAAFGVGQVLLSPGCASPWGAKALRAGQGAQLAVNSFEDVELTHAYAGFKASNTPIATTSLSAQSIPLAQLSYKHVNQTMVWVFGNEGQGISATSQAAATQCVHIPMLGGFESLNVASAAAICLWHSSQT